MEISEIRKLCDDFRKQVGNSIRFASEVPKISTIPIGFAGVDNYVLGIGGVPRGRIVELFGENSSGKSTLALKLVANAQRLGNICVWCDAEGAYDQVWAAKMGVDNTKLIIPDFNFGEDILAAIKWFVAKGVDLIVIDSVAGLRAKEAVETKDEDTTMRTSLSRAIMLTQFFESLAGGFVVEKSRSAERYKLQDCKASLVFINHVKKRVGVNFGVKEETPGGAALKFFASCRLSLHISRDKMKRERINEGSLVDEISVRCIKNKLAPPFRECSLRLVRTGDMVENKAYLVDLAVAKGIIRDEHGWLVILSGKFDGFKFHGAEEFGEFCVNKPEFLEEVISDGVVSGVSRDLISGKVRELLTEAGSE